MEKITWIQNLRPILAPSLPYDAYLFHDEINTLLAVYLSNSVEDPVSITKSARRAFEDRMSGDDALPIDVIYSVILYNVVQTLVFKNNNYSYKESSGFREMFVNDDTSVLASFLSIQPYKKIQKFFSDKEMFINAISKEVIHEDDIDDYEDSDMEEILYGISEDVSAIRHHLTEEDNEEEVEEEEVKEHIERPEKPSSGPRFAVNWFGPPPIIPLDIWDFSMLTSSQSGLILNAFLDVYRAEMLMLSFYFLTRKTLDLWQKEESSVFSIEDVLFKKEGQEILSIIRGISELLEDFSSLSFLSLEGITCPGEVLKSISLISKTSNSEDPILDGKKFVESMVRLIKTTCIALERLRVSFLYGRDHTSYIGDSFLSSYLCFNYKVHHFSMTLENVAAFSFLLGGMAVSGQDELEVMQYIDQLVYSDSKKEAKRHGLIDPIRRTEYKDMFEESHRDTIPEEGEIVSKMNSDTTAFLGILEKLWN